MTEQPPAAVTEDLDRLRAALDAAIPARTDSNLLIGTWNIRALGDLTDKWLAGPKDSPKRDWHAIACLAAVISRFDVVAVQESRRNPKALKRLLATLGPQWRVIISDATEGAAGNGERLAFLYDSTRVQPSGLVGEIVLPPIGEEPARQFARTPYTASFNRAGVEFTLASVHVLWGKSPAERLPEITAFAEWMHDWAVRPNDWNANLMVLGDFNLDRIGDPLYEAFIATGLWPPTELDKVPRTIFDNDNSQHFYDQIAWFSKTNGTSLMQGLTYAQRAGSFDFIPQVYPGLTRSEVSWRISDHYPLWCEFLIG
ncbi:endonuclease/exonuclease/phosphatase family protein [Arthrobacter sp. UYCo732]|uniref:endonuclease/exonuclease/phosphatase family protein n=1 Tax=Arthrobacter sp. UYCo732 TaxID=3156336 RepID=UPI00339A4686